MHWNSVHNWSSRSHASSHVPILPISPQFMQSGGCSCSQRYSCSSQQQAGPEAIRSLESTPLLLRNGRPLKPQTEGKRQFVRLIRLVPWFAFWPILRLLPMAAQCKRCCSKRYWHTGFLVEFSNRERKDLSDISSHAESTLEFPGISATDPSAEHSRDSLSTATQLFLLLLHILLTDEARLASHFEGYTHPCLIFSTCSSYSCIRLAQKHMPWLLANHF